MRFEIRAVAAALLVLGATPAVAQPAASCEIHIFPAERLQSVGEDFDAVHRLDQDLKDYNRAAGRSLGWLTPERQLQLLSELDVGRMLDLPSATARPHSKPLRRSEALRPGPHIAPPPPCLVEVMIPQILMERGGLSSRSLRLFGIVRHYRDGGQSRSYSGFASAELLGFRLKEPADADAATSLVERAYVEAVRRLVVRSTFHSRPN